MPRTRSVAADIGSLMRSARREAGLSQAQLAEQLETTQSAVSLYEAGTRGVSIDMAMRIARVLGKPVSYFFGGDATFKRVTDPAMRDFLAQVEKRPEDLQALLRYWGWLVWKRRKGQ